MKEKRKRFIQVFALALIMLFIASSTYAYFVAQVGEGSNTDIIIATSTVDSLTFETGDAISISATENNFGTGDGNLSGSTYASATLVANNSSNEASNNYYLYLKIDSNTYTYTTVDETAELMLKITDPDGVEITSLSGLVYTTVTDANGNLISGFDITKKNGLITIANNYKISTNGVNTQKWNIEVIFVNLTTNQEKNGGASFNANLIIQNSKYGNTLQSVSSVYSSKIWEYKNSITSISFNIGSTSINNYEAVYDITEHATCYYNDNVVLNFADLDASNITEDTCENVYVAIDDDYTFYSDSTLEDYIIDAGTAVWSDGVCKTSSGEQVYTWYYSNTPSEDECSGEVYYTTVTNKYVVGISYVGSGDWVGIDKNEGKILAYIVNNGDSTYSVYIESDKEIIANSDMGFWFYGFSSLKTIDGLDNITTSNTTNMNGLFRSCSSLTQLDLSNWDTSSVTNMRFMFDGCSSLTDLNLSNWDTSQVTTMEKMFYSCSRLTSLDLSSFETSKVTNITEMFYLCSSLTTLNLSNANFSNVTSYTKMFWYMPSSLVITVKDQDAYNFITLRLNEANGGTVVIA